MDQLDLLSVGDVTMDSFILPTESESFCILDDKESYICFTYGDKIPVKTLDFSVGGNAGNNAVGATRLGLKVGLVSTLGGDSVGNQIVEKLENEGVDMTFVVQQPTAASNYSTVITYSGERTIFSYHAPRSYEFPVKLAAIPWVYLTSMGESFQPFYNHFLDWLDQHNDIKLAFNPGSRQIRVGIDLLKPVLNKTHVIYVNREEAETLTGMDDSHNKEKDLVTKLFGLGPKICIITDGANGAYLFDGKRFLHSGVLPVDAYERTGAGDAFGAGCIAALIQEKSYEEALLWGTVNSASVIGYIGSQRGLLKKQELPEWLERAKSSGVKIEEIY